MYGSELVWLESVIERDETDVCGSKIVTQEALGAFKLTYGPNAWQTLMTHTYKLKIAEMWYLAFEILFYWVNMLVTYFNYFQ